MAVVFKGEDPDGQEADNDQGKRTYSRRFKLETTLKTDTPYAVGSHGSLPIIGQVYPDDSGAWCKSLSVRRNKGNAWFVTATYSTERELATDPTNDPAIITVHTEQFQKEAETDSAGDAVVNAAGDPFDPSYMMDDSRRVISVSKNMSGHPSWVLSYQDVVNSDTFTVKGVTYAIGVGKVQRVAIGEQQTRNGVPFVVVTFEIHCERDGWVLRPKQVGFREKSGATRINIINSGDSEQPTAPVAIDAAGAAIDDPTPATIIYGAYTIYTTAAFSALPLT